MSVRVLLVEDEPLIALDTQSVLEDLGHAVIAVCPTLAAAEAKLDEGFDLALLDVDLPDGRSFGLAEALRRRGRAFAFVTGARAADVPDALRDAPFLPKPFAPFALAQIIAALEPAMPRAASLRPALQPAVVTAP